MDNGQLKMENEKNNSQLSTVNFQLPEGWDVKKLGEVYSFKNGVNFNKNDKTGDGILTIDVLNMYTDSLNPNLNKLYRVNKIFSKEYKLLPNDILIVRSSVKREGVAWATYFNSYSEEVTFCGFIIRGRPLKPIVPDYSVYYLRSPKVRKELINKSIKSTITNINQQILSEVQIPIPPLPEQKRIVKILDKAFQAIDKAKENAEKNLQNAKELFESYLNGIFANGQLKIDNGEWEEKKLGEVCGFVRGPFGGSLKKAIFKPSGYAVYEQQHAIYNQFHKIRYFIDEKKFIEMKRFELNSGDLIMSCSGTMGKVAIVPKRIEKGIINQALLKLSPKNKLHVEYLKIWMGSNDFQNQITKHSQGAAIKNVASVKILKEIELPIPQMTEQNQIVKKLDAIQTETKLLEKIYQQKIADVEELKKSILQRAFEGEL